jgi:hypothetical protein
VFQPNGISLHVEDHGSGKPVVLLHGCSPLSRCVTDACRSEATSELFAKLVSRTPQTKAKPDSPPLSLALKADRPSQLMTVFPFPRYR